jgi:hypothetical protein
LGDAKLISGVVVIQTFFRHWKKKAKRLKDGRGPETPQDDIFFDQ